MVRLGEVTATFDKLAIVSAPGVMAIFAAVRFRLRPRPNQTVDAQAQSAAGIVAAEMYGR